MFLPDRYSPKPFNVCVCENGVYRVQFILVCFSRIRIPVKGCNFAAYITKLINAKNIGKSVIWGLINLYEHGIDKLFKYAAVAELVDAQRWGRCGVNTPWKFESSQPHHFLSHRTSETYVNPLLSRAFRCVTVWVVLLWYNKEYNISYGRRVGLTTSSEECLRIFRNIIRLLGWLFALRRRDEIAQ